ncbi:ATP-grasp domain-containing protein [Streptomyces sp. NPDC000987]|uniref:ATP-grasp domain-containing protein n=1 Tax=Streptomyces sp. NPDC000987 TaxID=3154374 RepID=UPI003321D0F9
MTTIAVTYDYGSVNVAEIAMGLGHLGDLVFVGEDSPHTTPLIPLLQDLGEVVRLDRGFDEAADRLAVLAPDAIVSYSDAMLPVTARLAERLGLPYHSVGTASLLTDKSRQRQRLRETGVEDVRSAALTTPGDWAAAVAAVGLPAVLKPVHGQGSRDAHLVTDADAGRALFTALIGSAQPAGTPAFVLEEYLVGRPSDPFGDYVSVETVCTPSGRVPLAVSGKLPQLTPFRETGQVWPSPLPKEEIQQIEDLVDRALDALGVTTGITHTEVKLTADGPRIVEVNGRLGGRINEMCRRALGFDCVELSGRLALGLTAWTPPPPPRGFHFQYIPPAPVEEFTLEEVHGIDAVRALPGVVAYRPTVEPGEHWPTSVMTRPLDTVTGAGGSFEEVFATMERARRLLSYTFTFAGGTRTLTAAELEHLPVTVPGGEAR